MGFVALVLGIALLGALLGGRSFGETLRKGCGCLSAILFLAFLAAFSLFLIGLSAEDATPDPVRRTHPGSTTYRVSRSTPAHVRPDIRSDTLLLLTPGTRLVVDDPERYRYFYGFFTSEGLRAYVLKDQVTHTEP